MGLSIHVRIRHLTAVHPRIGRALVILLTRVLRLTMLASDWATRGCFLASACRLFSRSNLLGLIPLNTYANYRNNAWPIIFHYCLDQHQSQLAQVSWHIPDMMLAGFELLDSDLWSCARCWPIPRHSFSSFQILLSMLTNAPLIASSALMTSLRMSVIGSSTITPFLAKPTWLAYVIPCATSATHNVSISSHKTPHQSTPYRHQ